MQRHTITWHACSSRTKIGTLPKSTTTEAIAAQPNFAAAHTNLGILLLDLKQTEQEIKHLKTALQLQEDLINYEMLALAFIQANRSTEAVEVARKAISLAYLQCDITAFGRFQAFLAAAREEE